MTLDFDSLPGYPWQTNANGGAATTAGGILTIDTPSWYEILLWHPHDTWHQHVDNAKGWAIETRLRIDPTTQGELGGGPGPVAIWAHDHTNLVMIGFSTNGVGITYPDQVTVPLNTTDEFHTYRIESQLREVRIYVDGVLRIDHTLGWSGGGSDVLYFGDGGGGGSSRSYWDYFSYEVYVDEPTLLMTPAFVIAKAGDPLVLPISARDPDGDPVDSLFAWSIPPSAHFEASPDEPSGQLTWTPSGSDVGSSEMVFAGRSYGFLTFGRTLVSVWSPELPPNLATNPSVEADMTGWNGYAGGTVERIQGGHDGAFALRVNGPSVMNGSFGVNDSPDVVHNTLGAGLVYRYTAWVRSATSQGTAKLRIREYRNATGIMAGEGTSDAVTLSPDWRLLTLDYTTKARESTLDFQVRDFPVVPSESFETDEIAVRNVTGQPGVVDVPRHPPAGDLRSRVVPSPIRSGGTLSFTTSRPGGLRVEILDLAGRRVRRLLDRADAPAGRRELAIPHGLDAGVYFYRIEARERTETGRFAVLR